MVTRLLDGVDYSQTIGYQFLHTEDTSSSRSAERGLLHRPIFHRIVLQKQRDG